MNYFVLSLDIRTFTRLAREKQFDETDILQFECYFLCLKKQQKYSLSLTITIHIFT